MSYVIIKQIKIGEVDYHHVEFEDGRTLEGTLEDYPDAFSLVDSYCHQYDKPLPTEWRYE